MTTTTIIVDEVIKHQFLSADLDSVNKLKEESKKDIWKPTIVWKNVLLFTLLHFGALIGLYQIFFIAKWPTVFWTFLCYMFSGLGITAGAHRLWSHKSYKAKWPMRLILMIFDCLAFQNDVIEWSRDHRCHHKWTDTHADPHNVNRGFFFSHMGWLLMKKHPKIKEFGAKLDMSDLLSDPILAFQRKYYIPLVIIWCFLFPTIFAVYLWGEHPLVAFYTATLFRYCWTLHATWFINSVAHKFGYRPYDITISPTENIWTCVAALGEGGHNYHHTFPQDYRTSELTLQFNLTKIFIDICATIGWAYDLKTIEQIMVEKQKAKNVELINSRNKVKNG